jgi:hypothetical protein
MMMTMMMQSFCLTLGDGGDAFGPAWWICIDRQV